jgi:HK97 gp10 family phage protein
MRVAGWGAGVAITKEIEGRAMDRLETAAGHIRDAARSNVPVNTGTLRDTIRVVRLKDDPKLDVRIYAGSRITGGAMKKGADRGAFYAHMVEYGTVKMKARPYMRPALSAVKGRIKGIVENG